MVEGDLWRYAQTDLADLYRGTLTLRQVFVRVWALPYESRTWGVFREECERSEARSKAAAVEDVLAQFKT